MCHPVKTQYTAQETHQLMKDDFPAEWLPIKRTTIFFCGASSLRLKCSAILIKPGTNHETSSWYHMFSIQLYSVHFKFY
jgi:hypothetical protein